MVFIFIDPGFNRKRNSVSDSAYARGALPGFAKLAVPIAGFTNGFVPQRLSPGYPHEINKSSGRPTSFKEEF
jgi:hypothetical protein